MGLTIQMWISHAVISFAVAMMTAWVVSFYKDECYRDRDTSGKWLYILFFIAHFLLFTYIGTEATLGFLH